MSTAELGPNWSVLDQLLWKRILITKYKLYIEKVIQLLFPITLATKAKIQNTFSESKEI